MKKCVWLRPEAVVQVEFLEWTEGDRLRHSKFVTMRDDKNPRAIVKEMQVTRFGVFSNLSQSCCLGLGDSAVR